MQVLIVAALVAVAAASQYGSVGPASGYGGASHATGYGGASHAAGYRGAGYNDYSAPQTYKFDYAVNDPHYGPQFAQSESNDGRTAQGYYSVALPDGRTQHVKYYADQAGYGGYNAEVTYTGGYGAHAAPGPSYQ